MPSNFYTGVKFFGDNGALTPIYCLLLFPLRLFDPEIGSHKKSRHYKNYKSYSTSFHSIVTFLVQKKEHSINSIAHIVSMYHSFTMFWYPIRPFPYHTKYIIIVQNTHNLATSCDQVLVAGVVSPFVGGGAVVDGAVAATGGGWLTGAP